MLQETDYHAEIRRLREENERLAAENYWFREQLKPLPIFVLSRRLGLSTKEAEFLGLLMKRSPSLVTRDMLYSATYQDATEIGAKIFDVVLCRVRRQLKINGLDPQIIETVWGRGWLIQEPGLNILKKLDNPELP